MSKIFRATASLPPIIVLHGLPGVGKTTLAADFPAPVFLQVEDGIPVGIELATFGLLKNYSAIIDALRYLGTDKVEPLIFAAVCAEHGYASIESPGYGRGYVQADSLWQELLRACEWLRRTRRMMIVMIAHSEIVTMNDPRAAGYSSYQLRLHKRARGLIEDAADLIGFLATDVVIKNEQIGFGKTRARADGGSTRWLHVEGRPAFVAKNRFGMPERIRIPQPFDFKELGKFFPRPQAGATTIAASEPDPEPESMENVND
jgi:hypothetical protein